MRKETILQSLQPNGHQRVLYINDAAWHAVSLMRYCSSTWQCIQGNWMELTQAMPLGHIEACRKQGNLSIHIYPMVIEQKQWEAPASVCKASIAYSTGRFSIAISNSEFTFRDCIGQYSIFMIDWHTLLAQTSQKHPDHQQTIWLLPFNSACPVNKHTQRTRSICSKVQGNTIEIWTLYSILWSPLKFLGFVICAVLPCQRVFFYLTNMPTP